MIKLYEATTKGFMQHRYFNLQLVITESVAKMSLILIWQHP